MTKPPIQRDKDVPSVTINHIDLVVKHTEREAYSSQEDDALVLLEKLD